MPGKPAPPGMPGKPPGPKPKGSRGPGSRPSSRSRSGSRSAEPNPKGTSLMRPPYAGRRHGSLGFRPVGSRTSTLVAAALLAAVLGLLAVTLPVPMVALGPGPTFDTLGEDEGRPVVAIDGLPTFPTSGHLNMTTVAVTDRLTLVRVLGFWASGQRQVVPRDAIFPAGKSDEQVQQENTQQFAASEQNAET